MPISQGSGGAGVPGCMLKAWVRMAANGTVLASMNVTSVTKGATGIYTVNFTAPMAGTGYVFRFTPGVSGNTGGPNAQLATGSTAAAAYVNTSVPLSGTPGYLLQDVGGVWEFWE